MEIIWFGLFLIEASVVEKSVSHVSEVVGKMPRKLFSVDTFWQLVRRDESGESEKKEKKE